MQLNHMFLIHKNIEMTVSVKILKDSEACM